MFHKIKATCGMWDIAQVGAIKTQRLRDMSLCEEDGICEVLPDLSIVRRSHI
jgi:hypothetical protein